MRVTRVGLAGWCTLAHMERNEFEALRDLPGKVIRQDIRLSRRAPLKPAMSAEGIRIESEASVELLLSITHNPEIGGKTFNVHVRGGKAICRLDVDGTPHRPCGRSHKHSLQSSRCLERNLPHAEDLPDLSGSTLTEAFQAFCAMAHVTHEGDFHVPDAES